MEEEQAVGLGAFPPPERGRVREGVTSSADLSPTRPPSAGDLPLSGGGEDRFAGGADTTAVPAQPLETAERLHRALIAEIAAVERMRAQLGPTPQAPADARGTAQTLAYLTNTLAQLQRVQAAGHGGAGARAGRGDNTTNGDHDDPPADIDAFRLDLARRIDAFVASRTQQEDAERSGDDPASSADALEP